MISYGSLQERISAVHPLRAIRAMTDRALGALSPSFNQLNVPRGRDTIPPERLLRAPLLQALHSVRPERQLMEQMRYNLLCRWFVTLNLDDALWDVTVLTKNRDRLLKGEVAKPFFEQALAQAAKLLSSEHCKADGTLIEAWGQPQRFRAQGRHAVPRAS